MGSPNVFTAVVQFEVIACCTAARVTFPAHSAWKVYASTRSLSSICLIQAILTSRIVLAGIADRTALSESANVPAPV